MIKQSNKLTIVLSYIFLLNPFLGFAGSASEKVVDPYYLSSYLGYLLAICGFTVVLATILYLARVFILIIQLEEKKILASRGIVPEPEVTEVEQIPLWRKIYSRLTKVVPVEKEKDVMLDHEYDGIRELDNSLPPWWVAMFYVTIAIGVVYFSYFHVLDRGLLSEQEYLAEMAIAERQQNLRLALQAESVNENNVVLLTDEKEIAEGASLFVKNCVACHGENGQGIIGPNLTDPYWLHGGGVKNVFKVIKHGVPEKGMIAWKRQLTPSNIQKIASFIISLNGTNPIGAKAPEGELYEEESSTNSEEIDNDGTIGMN